MGFSLISLFEGHPQKFSPHNLECPTHGPDVIDPLLIIVEYSHADPNN